MTGDPSPAELAAVPGKAFAATLAQLLRRR
jgi:hypothetical protein